MITATEMKKAVAKLCSNKSDAYGSHGLWSNHLVYAPGDIILMFICLATTMVVHGLIGTLVLVPKDKQ